MITAACHIHSDWSYDGSWTVANLAKLFKRRGVRVLLMTEHDRGFTPERYAAYREVCARESSIDLLIIPGIEYSDPTNTIHVLVWGMPFVGADLPTSTMLRSVKEAGGIAVLAHPSRRDAWSNYEQEWSDSLLGIEVWNRKTDGWAPSERAQHLIAKTGLTPFVGMDFHTRRQLFPLSLHLDVGDTATETSALQALRSRNFTATVLGRPLQSSFSPMMSATLLVAERFRRNVARYSRNLRAANVKRNPSS